MIDREADRIRSQKAKVSILKVVNAIAEVIKVAAAIGTVVAAFMAWATLNEMQTERDNAYRPEIVAVPNSFKGELLKEDELEVDHRYIYFDYNAESPDGFYSEDRLFTLEPLYKETCICLEWPYLTLKNIGQGTAKNIEVTFSSDWFVRAADQLSYYPESDRGVRIPRDYKVTARISSNDKEERVNIYYIDKDEKAHRLTLNSGPIETVGRTSNALKGEVLPKEYITYIASGDDSVDIMLPDIYCRMLGVFFYLPMERFKTEKLGGIAYPIDLPELVITIKYSDLQGKTYGPETITIPWTGSFKYVADFEAPDWKSEWKPKTMEIMTDFYEHYSR